VVRVVRKAILCEFWGGCGVDEGVMVQTSVDKKIGRLSEKEEGGRREGSGR
jgi:hypothetical protein